MIKEIKKEDIPNWDYGDVAIKTFSYGENLRISNWVKEIRKIPPTPENPKGSEETVLKDDVTNEDVGLFTMAAGIHYIRNRDQTGYVIAPNTDVNIKKDFAFKLDRDAGIYLQKAINEVNKPMTNEEKKNSF